MRIQRDEEATPDPPFQSPEIGAFDGTAGEFRQGVLDARSVAGTMRRQVEYLRRVEDVLLERLTTAADRLEAARRRADAAERRLEGVVAAHDSVLKLARKLGGLLLDAPRRRFRAMLGRPLPPPKKPTPRAALKDLRIPAPSGVVPPACGAPGPSWAGPPAAPALRRLKVGYLAPTAAHDGPSIRYRIDNVAAALEKSGVAAVRVAVDDVVDRFNELAACDVVVFFRLEPRPETALMLDALRERGTAAVYDVDDFVFDPNALSRIEAFKFCNAAVGMQLLHHFRAALRQCTYFTGPTRFLTDRAAAAGRSAHLLPNTMNDDQWAISRRLRENPPVADGVMRIGYFSGSKTHQNDFRVAAPAVADVLAARSDVRLVVVGDLDLAEYADLAPFVGEAGRVERRPLVGWRDLPAEVARVDVCLVPLQPTDFNDAKSELKYFEAAAVGVPTIASPTDAYHRAVDDGVDGLLADGRAAWRDAILRCLDDEPFRRRLAAAALRRVEETYSPAALARSAPVVLQRIVAEHRRRLGVASSAPVVDVLWQPWRTETIDALGRVIHDEPPPVARLAAAFAARGASVRLTIVAPGYWRSAADPVRELRRAG
ncbi:MAG: glycosyltransferase, partial [Planctomycetia bacterium]